MNEILVVQKYMRILITAEVIYFKGSIPGSGGYSGCLSGSSVGWSNRSDGMAIEVCGTPVYNPHHQPCGTSPVRRGHLLCTTELGHIIHVRTL